MNICSKKIEFLKWELNVVLTISTEDKEQEQYIHVVDHFVSYKIEMIQKNTIWIITMYSMACTEH